MQNPVELLAIMKMFLGFDKNDVVRMEDLKSVLVPYTAEMVQKFYASLEQLEDCRKTIATRPEQRETLQNILVTWYAEIFSGNYGSEYAERRWNIVLMLLKDEIPFYCVIGAIGTVYLFSARKLNEDVVTFSGDVLPYVESLSKLLQIDLSFIEQAYEQSMSSAIMLDSGISQTMFHRIVESRFTFLLDEIDQKS